MQIDTISVVARAHHHVLFTRVSRYREDMLNRLVRERRAFEYWRHAAAYMPLKDYRFSLPMMRNIARGELKWFRDPDRKLMARVKDRIREEGPLFARDFEDTRASKEGWWDWKPAKPALEQLFMEGVLTSVERQGFQKRYDLMERFLPDEVNTSEPGDGEYADHVIDRALRAHIGWYLRKSQHRLQSELESSFCGLVSDGTESHCSPESPPSLVTREESLVSFHEQAHGIPHPIHDAHTSPPSASRPRPLAMPASSGPGNASEPRPQSPSISAPRLSPHCSCQTQRFAYDFHSLNNSSTCHRNR